MLAEEPTVNQNETLYTRRLLTRLSPAEKESEKKPMNLMVSLMTLGKHTQWNRWECTLYFSSWREKQEVVGCVFFVKFGRERKEIDNIVVDEEKVTGKERLLFKRRTVTLCTFLSWGEEFYENTWLEKKWEVRRSFTSKFSERVGQVALREHLEALSFFLWKGR